MSRVFSLIAIAVCTVAGVYLRVFLTKWHNTFIQTLADYNYPGFWRQLTLFLPIVIGLLSMQALSQYLSAHLSFEWRAHTVNLLKTSWLRNANFYRLTRERHIDHPDQRLTQDTMVVTGSALKLILLFTEKLMTLSVFSWMLWVQSRLLTISWGGQDYPIPGLLLWIVLIYCALGTSIAVFTGRKIVPLTIEQEKNEARFRYYLIRLIEHAQSAALRRGEQYEARVLKRSFHAIELNFYALLLEIIKLDTYTQGYVTINAFVPLLLVGPYYFKKLITLGMLMQIKDVFLYVYDALSQMVFNYQEILRTHAALKRVHEFYEALSPIQPTQPLNFTPYLRTHNLKILNEDAHLLCSIPDMHINLGERVWIRGPSGSGKSSFLKTLAGLHTHYTGHVSLPEDSIYMPSALYLPPGSLRQALVYPHLESQHDALSLMSSVRLNKLVRFLDQEDYHNQISMGEQQRIMLASLFSIGETECLFLDEPTAHLSPELTEQVLQELFAQHPKSMIIIVSHDAYPADWFDHIIEIAPEPQTD